MDTHALFAARQLACLLSCTLLLFTLVLDCMSGASARRKSNCSGRSPLRVRPRESFSSGQMRLGAGVGENAVVTSVRARRLSRLRQTRRWVETAGSTHGEGFSPWILQWERVHGREACASSMKLSMASVSQQRHRFLVVDFDDRNRSMSCGRRDGGELAQMLQGH